MLSALRNFALAFFICLLVFGYVGYQYIWPTVSAMVDFDTAVSRAEEVSEDTSEDVSGSVIINPTTDGRTITTLFICKNSSGNICAVLFARANSSNSRFTYCRIPLTAKVLNNVGIEVPLSYYLLDASLSAAKAKVSSITGFTIDKCVVVTPEAVSALVSKLRNPYFDVSRSIKMINPVYSSISFNPGEEPEDYYITLGVARHTLDSATALAILSQSVTVIGSDPTTVAGDLYASLFAQFMTNSGTKRNSSNIAQLLNYVQSDITVTDVENTLDIFFTYDEYTQTTVSYPNDWASAVAAFKKADGIK